MVNRPRLKLLFSGLPAQCDTFHLGISSVVLVQTADQNILFDTGPYAYRPILQGRLKKYDIDPLSIKMVVLSHIHWDTFANADLFPNAIIVVHARELDHGDSVETGDPRLPQYATKALRRLRLNVVRREEELAPGVELIELPGHTPGSQGLLAGDTLLAGDAVSWAGEAAGREAYEPPNDPIETQASLAKALGKANIIYPCHDRPFRVGPTVSYVEDYALRLRLFTDPTGQDEELRIGGFAPKSFASWPEE